MALLDLRDASQLLSRLHALGLTVASISATGASLLLLNHQQLDALVQCRHDVALLDEQTGARRDVNSTIGADGSVLAASATNRQAQRLAHRLRLLVRPVGRQVGDLDVHRRTHASAQVRRARRHVAVLVAAGELDALDGLHHLQHLVQALEHLVQLRALLHAHDAQLVLLTEPDDALAVIALPAATAVRPVR